MTFSFKGPCCCFYLLKQFVVKVGYCAIYSITSNGTMKFKDESKPYACIISSPVLNTGIAIAVIPVLASVSASAFLSD